MTKRALVYRPLTSGSPSVFQHCVAEILRRPSSPFEDLLHDRVS